jgi:hypothetical protein
MNTLFSLFLDGKRPYNDRNGGRLSSEGFGLWTRRGQAVPTETGAW